MGVGYRVASLENMGVRNAVRKDLSGDGEEGWWLAEERGGVVSMSLVSTC